MNPNKLSVFTLTSFRSLAWMLMAILSFSSGVSQEKKKQFHPAAEKWEDTNGTHINAHGGGILLDGDTYYWFGEHKIAGPQGNRAMVGVHVYSSKDLYNWKDEGIALKMKEDPASMLQVGSTVERPKVIYNDSTEKYVMWFHHELKGQGYSAALTGVAVSDNVTGPYEYIDSFRLHPEVWPENFTDEQKMEAARAWINTDNGHQELGDKGGYLLRDFREGQMSRDMTLFKDDDGSAYHITASESNQTLHISKLSDDYLSVTDEYVRIFPGGRNEAPAIFKKDGTYYLISSGLTGWRPNPARSAMAKNIFGPWTALGNPVRGTDKEIATTFNSQSTFVLPAPGKEDEFIFMADRWRPENPIDGSYLWLPIEFEGKKPVLRWKDSWDLSYFDKK